MNLSVLVKLMITAALVWFAVMNMHVNSQTLSQAHSATLWTLCTFCSVYALWTNVAMFLLSVLLFDL